MGDYDLVAQLDDSQLTILSAPQHYTAIDKGTVFVATSPAHGRELWFTDRTTNETQLIADLNPGIRYTDFFSFIPLGEYAAFTVFDAPSNGTTPSGSARLKTYITDGTTEGTRQVVIDGSGADFFGADLVAASGAVYTYSGGRFWSIDIAHAKAHEIGLGVNNFEYIPSQAPIVHDGKIYFSGNFNNEVRVIDDPGSGSPSRLLTRLPEDSGVRLICRRR